MRWNSENELKIIKKDMKLYENEEAGWSERDVEQHCSVFCANFVIFNIYNFYYSLTKWKHELELLLCILSSMYISYLILIHKFLLTICYCFIFEVSITILLNENSIMCYFTLEKFTKHPYHPKVFRWRWLMFKYFIYIDLGLMERSWCWGYNLQNIIQEYNERVFLNYQH